MIHDDVSVVALLLLLAIVFSTGNLPARNVSAENVSHILIWVSTTVGGTGSSGIDHCQV